MKLTLPCLGICLFLITHTLTASSGYGNSKNISSESLKFGADDVLSGTHHPFLQLSICGQEQTYLLILMALAVVVGFIIFATRSALRNEPDESSDIDSDL